MPSEFRKITFSTDEIRTIMSDYDRRGKKMLAGKEIVSLNSETLASGVVEIACSERGANVLQVINIEVEYLGAALIRYCINRHIPIPKAATRTILAARNGVSLCFYLDEPVKPADVRLPDYFDYDFFG